MISTTSSVAYVQDGFSAAVALINWRDYGDCGLLRRQNMVIRPGHLIKDEVITKTRMGFG
ncbi:hypothetical protein E2C01_029088 [Portunus trituberculatus]|uniref:Uncharacterized protein n=1 Tax=Portunus trituberculatus TaxID=210409 RepID=A0A5B7EM66_PORTR|nr:hypothetical protein [Portunus trituberculatus]